MLLRPKRLLCCCRSPRLCSQSYSLYHLSHLGVLNAKAEAVTMLPSWCQHVWSTALPPAEQGDALEKRWNHHITLERSKG